MSTVKFNLENPIPKNKIVEIINANGSITGEHPLILDDDYSIKTSSKYGQLWEGSSNNLMSLLSSSYNLPSGQFALQGLQIWQSTDPITLDFTVRLEMDDNPYLDVVCPCLVLMNTVLPKLSNGTEGILGQTEQLVEKHFNIKLKTLIPPGPNIQSIVQTMSANSNANPLASNDGKSGVYNLNLGFLKFKNVIITSVEPKFSKEVSYYLNKPYPVNAEVSMSVSTMEVATTNMISQII